MKRFALPPFLVAVALGFGCSSGKSDSAGGSAALTTEDQKTFYALGLTVARNLKQFHLSPSELDLVKRGLNDGILEKKALVDLEVYGPKIQPLAHSRMMVGVEEEKKKGTAFADKAAAEPGAVKLPSGLVVKTMTPGTGASPTAADRVKVHYHGTLIDGTVFDSSVERKQPAEFPLGGVIPCWTEGVQKMKVGEKARLICPSTIAYGDGGRPPKIPGGATLVFEVELLEILAATTPPPQPALSLPPGMKLPPGMTKLPPGMPKLPPPMKQK